MGGSGDEVVIEPSHGVGYLGEFAWYIPTHLADEIPAMTTHFGLSGEKNRQALAETFDRPFRWIDYCNVATFNGTLMEAGCHEDDTTAIRWPENSNEESSFFIAGLYTGFFHPTDKNNCTANPYTCTGHFVAAPCGK